jgi:hypothetical protein
MNKTNDIQNQETRVDIHAQEEVQAAEAQPQSGESLEVKNTDKAGRIKQVAAGAGGAIAGAAGVGAIMGFVVPDDVPESAASVGSHRSAQADPLPSAADFDGSEVPEASHVNDDMSFAEAFASARQETGAGGVFVWRGGVYGTYYRDEWSQLSPEYRESFSNYPYHRPEDALAGTATAASEPSDAADPAIDTGDNPVEEQVQADIPPVEVNDTGSADTTADSTAATASEPSDAADPATDAGDNPVEEQVQADVPPVEVNDTGSADTAGDAEVLGVQYVDGRDALLVDVDTDGVFDYTIADNGTPEPEVFDISEQQITHEDAADIQQAQQQASDTDDNNLVDNNLPDYTNNASAEQFLNV